MSGHPVTIADGQTLEQVDFTLPRGSAITGHVTDEFGEPITGVQVQDYVVIVQPAESKEGSAATRYVRTARPDQEGRFRIRALPPGRYLAAAVESLEQGREWDPEFSRRVRESGTVFTLTEGQTQALSLKLSNIQ
jgi:hypothetical protein